MADNCNRTNIYNFATTAERCSFVKENCADDVNVFDMTSFYFCTLDENWYLMLIISILIIVILFRLISDVSDDYLSVALNRLSVKFKFSEALTGVTLLALANGAPDVISSMVAGGDDGGALISIGALYGASLFTCNFVFSSVIANSPGKIIKIPAKYFLRDVSTFFFCTTLLIILGFFELKLYIISVIFFTIYLLYAILVVYMEVKENKKKKATNNKLNPNTTDLAAQINESLNGEDDDLGIDSDLKEGSKNQSESSVHPELMSQNVFRNFWLKYTHHLNEKWDERNIIEKILYVVEKFTIPPGEEKEFHYILGLIYPFTCITFGIFATQITIFFNVKIFGYSIQILLLCLPIMIILSILIAVTSEEHKPKPGLLFIIFSAVMAVLWIYIEANFIMDFLQFVQYISGWSKVFLSLSLLSLGNSLGDLFVDTALAKKGYGVMAMTGVFSGQLFNLMIGFALNCLFSYMSAVKGNTGDITFKIFDKNLLHDSTQFLTFFVMAYSSIRLGSYLVNGFFSKFTFPSIHQYIGTGVYILFLVCFILLEFVIYKK